MATVINNAPDGDTSNSGGSNNLVWLIVIVLLIVIGYFVYVATQRDTADTNTTNITVEDNATSQPTTAPTTSSTTTP
jgi:hypothetical protein